MCVRGRCTSAGKWIFDSPSVTLCSNFAVPGITCYHCHTNSHIVISALSLPLLSQHCHYQRCNITISTITVTVLCSFLLSHCCTHHCLTAVIPLVWSTCTGILIPTRQIIWGDCWLIRIRLRWVREMENSSFWQLTSWISTNFDVLFLEAFALRCSSGSDWKHLAVWYLPTAQDQGLKN